MKLASEAKNPVPPRLPKPYYQDKLVTIYHGDCRQIVPLLPKADLLLTDPPYGINVCAKGTIGTSPKPGNKRKSKCMAKCTHFGRVDWDHAPPPTWLLQMLLDAAKWQIIWGGNYYPQIGPSRGMLVWDKRNDATAFADAELAWTNLNKAVRIFRWRWNGFLQEDMKNKETRVHPTQKPVPLMEWCIGHIKPTPNLILDPYMGAGSTLLAAKARGIPCIGIDQHSPYLDKAILRIASY